MKTMNNPSGWRFHKWSGVAGTLWVLVVLAGMIRSTPVAAQNTAFPYGCACLNNKVQSEVRYRYKWGQGEWKTLTLPPKMQQVLCWTYSDSATSPDLLFELDTDLTARNTWKTFTIKRAQSRSKECSAVSPSSHFHIGYVAGSNRTKIYIFSDH